MISTCTGVVGRVYEYEGDVDALLDEIERDVLRISEERVETQNQTIKDLVHKAINTHRGYHQRQGILTGWQRFPRSGQDDQRLAWRGNDRHCRAAEHGEDLAGHEHRGARGDRQKLPVGVFSLEMTAESLVLRMLCSRARVNLRNIREDFLAERDFPEADRRGGETGECAALYRRQLGLSILQLRAKARRMCQQYGDQAVCD